MELGLCPGGSGSRGRTVSSREWRTVLSVRMGSGCCADHRQGYGERRLESR